MLDQRKIIVFKAIVEEFISTAEPVGSKTLMERHRLPYSSATIRNEMMELEKMGLLEKTHTSSGRIPSTFGYRYYVEYLMDRFDDQDLSIAVKNVLSDSSIQTDELIKRACDILSQMTNMTSIVLGNDAYHERLEHIKLFPLDSKSAVAVIVTSSGHTEHKVFKFEDVVSLKDLEKCTSILNDRLKGTLLHEVGEKMYAIQPLIKQSVDRYEILFAAFMDAFKRFASDSVYYSGKTNMMYQPEFTDMEKVKELMSLVTDVSLLHNIDKTSSEVLKTDTNSTLTWIDNLAIITRNLKINDEEGARLMLVGPSRMEYDRVLALVEELSESLEQIFKGGNSEE